MEPATGPQGEAIVPAAAANDLTIEGNVAADVVFRPEIVLTPSQRDGLTSAEVETRRKKYGSNEVVQERPSAILRFLRTFWGPVPFMLILTVVISGVLRKWETLGMVLALLLANSVIGFWEEQRSQAAVDALKKELTIESLVLRDGKWGRVASRDLVPGDIVKVSAGEFVTADLRVLEGSADVNQSMLNGESLPSTKTPGKRIKSGCVVTKNVITRAIVLRTGKRSSFGTLIDLVDKSKPEMHAQVVTGRVAFILLVATMILAACVLVYVAARHADFLEALPVVIMIIVSGMPSALPAMFALTMALGSRELSSRKVLIKGLEATEDAARMRVLCADKTGTLTLNKLGYACAHAAVAPPLAAAVSAAAAERAAAGDAEAALRAAAIAAAAGTPLSAERRTVPADSVNRVISLAVAAEEAGRVAPDAVFPPAPLFPPRAGSAAGAGAGAAGDAGSQALVAAAGEAAALFAAALASNDVGADAIDSALLLAARRSGNAELVRQLFGWQAARDLAARGIDLPTPTASSTSTLTPSAAFDGAGDGASPSSGAGSTAVAVAVAAEASSKSSSGSSRPGGCDIHGRGCNDPAVCAHDRQVADKAKGAPLTEEEKAAKHAAKEARRAAAAAREAALMSKAQCEWQLLEALPFDHHTRCTQSVYRHARSGRLLRVIKGAVEEVTRLVAASRLGDDRPLPSAAQIESMNALALAGPDAATPTAAAAASLPSPPAAAAAGAAAGGEDEFAAGVALLRWSLAQDKALSDRGLRALAIAASELLPLRPEEPADAASPTAATAAPAAPVPAPGPERDALLAAAKARPLHLLGLVPLRDPPRPDTARAIAALASLGVRTIMITGDAHNIAANIGREVGLPGEARLYHDMTHMRASTSPAAAAAKRNAAAAAAGGGGAADGKANGDSSDDEGDDDDEDEEDKPASGSAGKRRGCCGGSSDSKADTPAGAASGGSGDVPSKASPATAASGSPHEPSMFVDAEGRPISEEQANALLVEQARTAGGFAKVLPEEKHRIVSALQANGFVTGMTGDGVNDAPALAQAEVGVAVNNATDIAKKAGRAVLMRDGLRGIIQLVRVSRTIHQRIETWVLNKTAKEFIMAFFIVILYFATGLWIVGAFELGLLLLLIDFVTLSIAADNAPGSSKPQTWELGPLFAVGCLLGVVGLAGCLALFVISNAALGYSPADPRMSTFCFTLIFFFCATNVFVARERRWFWSSRPGWFLLGFVAVDSLIVIAIAAAGVPDLPAIPVGDIFIILIWSLLVGLILGDAVKVAYFTGCRCWARSHNSHRTCYHICGCACKPRGRGGSAGGSGDDACCDGCCGRSADGASKGSSSGSGAGSVQGAAAGRGADEGVPLLADEHDHEHDHEHDAEAAAGAGVADSKLQQRRGAGARRCTTEGCDGKRSASAASPSAAGSRSHSGAGAGHAHSHSHSHDGDEEDVDEHDGADVLADSSDEDSDDSDDDGFEVAAAGGSSRSKRKAE